MFVWYSTILWDQSQRSSLQDIEEIATWHSACCCVAWDDLLYMERKTTIGWQRQKKHKRNTPYWILLYFTLMRIPSEAINELFGISDHFDLSGMDGLANNHSGVNQDNSAAGNMVAKLNNYLNVDNSSDSSSDECEGCCEEDRSTQIQVGFSETIRKKDLNLPNIWRNSVHISSLLVNLKNFDQKL